MLNSYILSLLIIFLLIRGLFSKTIKFASWHMFTKIDRVFFYLTLEDEEFNPWEILPHSHLAMNLEELIFFLEYCKYERKLSLNGYVVCLNGLRIKKIKVIECRLHDHSKSL